MPSHDSIIFIVIFFSYPSQAYIGLCSPILTFSVTTPILIFINYIRGLPNEFKAFALKGNMIDMAVAVIIGGAFNGLITSLVENVVMPALSLITGKIDFSNMFLALNGEHYATLEAAKEQTSVVAYGLFVTQLINFLIMAFVVFLVIRQLNKLYKKPAPPAEPTEKECPYCKTKIAIAATRCPHCTSILSDEIQKEAAAALTEK